MKRILFFLLFAISVIANGQMMLPGIIASSGSSSTLNNGLVGYWWLDETTGNAIDQISSNNLVVSGAVPNQTGKYSTCYSFDGSNDILSTGGNVSALVPSNALTVSAWINTSATGYFGICGVWAYNTGGYFISVESTKLRFWVGSSSSTNALITGNTNINTGTFVHVVGVYNGSNLTIYVNGSSDATPVNYSSGISASAKFCIGDNDATGNIPFNGRIDDVRVYNRAFTSSEVTSLYNLTK